MPAQQGYPQPATYTQPGANGGHYQQHQQPRLMYFITRTNGTTVPLIPADELPYSVRLEGAPRNMSPEQVFGMQFLGCLPYTGMFFKTKDESTSMQRASSQPGTMAHHRQYSNGKQYMAPDALARQATANATHHTHSLSNPYSKQTTPPSPTTTSESTPTPPLTDPQAIIDAIVSSKAGTETAARIGYTPRSTISAPPSGKVPDSNKKTHCSYWIRTGECDYAQQGCMYKHEMPDEKGLAELGFRTTPRWWVEKNQAIKLGTGISVKRATVGPAVKPTEWLRKQSLVSTASAKSDGSETEVESIEAKSRVQAVGKATAVDTLGHGAKVDSKKEQAPEKKITILKKPAAATDEEDSSTSEASRSTDSGDLIDFGISGSSSSPSSDKAPTVTPPTSTDSSPRVSPSGLKTNVTGQPAASKAIEIFVPRGESKTQHLADHASRKQRSAARRNRPSEAQIASLEKQIQQAQKSKHIARARTNGGDGLMASRHAPAGNIKGGEGRRSDRAATGLRVRRPAKQCVEIPTGKKLQEKAEAESKKQATAEQVARREGEKKA